MGLHQDARRALNRLHDRSYPSIGCAPYTRAVWPGGEHVRFGRFLPGRRSQPSGAGVPGLVRGVIAFMNTSTTRLAVFLVFPALLPGCGGGGGGDALSFRWTMEVPAGSRAWVNSDSRNRPVHQGSSGPRCLRQRGLEEVNANVELKRLLPA